MIVQRFFKRVFQSFGPSIEGFKYCRPLINVDRTYLYWRYDEKLLIAIVFYANNRLFPWVFAIVDEENLIGDDFYFAYKDTLLMIEQVYV